MEKAKIQEGIDIEVVEVEDKKVTVAELEKLNVLENERNIVAMNMGILTYNWQKAMDSYKIQLEKSMEEQKRLGTLILSLHGYDPEKQNFNIDLKTGLITVI